MLKGTFWAQLKARNRLLTFEVQSGMYPAVLLWTMTSWELLLWIEQFQTEILTTYRDWILYTRIFLVAVQEVYINRSCLKEDLIKTFMVVESHGLAGMKLIDERGKVEEGDGEGVIRDIIATF